MSHNPYLKVSNGQGIWDTLYRRKEFKLWFRNSRSWEEISDLKSEFQLEFRVRAVARGETGELYQRLPPPHCSRLLFIGFLSHLSFLLIIFKAFLVEDWGESGGGGEKRTIAWQQE